jgi:hypothetical protein
MRKIDIMASANFHTNFVSEDRTKLQERSWLERLAEGATRVARMMADSDETSRVLRRRRYALLLG